MKDVLILFAFMAVLALGTFAAIRYTEPEPRKRPSDIEISIKVKQCNKLGLVAAYEYGGGYVCQPPKTLVIVQ